MSEEEEKISALQENISRKGKNSYYYAHGAKIDGPTWDGREEPRLIAKSSLQVTETTKKMVTVFDSFSWLDGTKTIKVFIDFNNASEVPDENISLCNTDKSIEFKVTVDSQEYGLVLSPLFKSITDATYKKKSDKFLITLKKTEEMEWTKLKETS